MSLPKTLLVPTDFGEVSEAALDTAIEYARVFNANIVVMHAYEIPIIGFPDGAIVATAELTSRILEGAQAGLERQIKNRSNSGVQIHGIIKQGDAHAMVNETCEEVGAGLIVMGTHGRRGLPRWLIGSVAERVVRTAQVPVITVHAPDTTKASTTAVQQPAVQQPAVQERTTVNGRDNPSRHH